MTTQLTRPSKRQRASVVVVDGDGPLTDTLASLLAGPELQVERGTAAADAVDLAIRAGEPGAAPALVVLTSTPSAHAARAVEHDWAPRWATWQARGIPHLPIQLDRHRVRVGPLVVPGSPCLHCLDLHRYDALRLGPGIGHASGAGDAEAPDAVLTSLGAAIAALVTRNLVLHRRHLPGVSLEVHLPEPRIVPRRWEPHPRCGTHDRRVTMGT